MISKISNYVVDSKYDKPRMSMCYISFYEESVETIRLNNIKENRNISVDVLLGERPSDDLLLRNDCTGNDIMSTLSPKIFTLEMSYNRYDNNNDVECAVFDLLNALTCTPNNFDINTKNLSISDIKRKIHIAVAKCDNSIKIESRRGGANTILMGTDMSKYEIDSVYNNVNIIITDKIPNNKVIVISSDNKCGIGINLVNNPDKSIFYLKETLDYHKVIKWFTVQ